MYIGMLNFSWLPWTRASGRAVLWGTRVLFLLSDLLDRGCQLRARVWRHPTNRYKRDVYTFLLSIFRTSCTCTSVLTVRNKKARALSSAQRIHVLWFEATDRNVFKKNVFNVRREREEKKHHPNGRNIVPKPQAHKLCQDKIKTATH